MPSSTMNPGLTDHDACLLPCKDRRQSSISTIPAISHPIFRNVWLLSRCSWTNILLATIPLTLLEGRDGKYQDINALTWLYTPRFILLLNCLAIISVTGLSRYARDSLSMAIRPPLRDIWETTIGTFSLDTVILLTALYHNHLHLLKAYFVGKVTATLLLNLGASFLASGTLRRTTSLDPATVRHVTIMLPTALLPFSITAIYPPASNNPELTLSRGSSIILLALYFISSYHQRTHSNRTREDSYPPTPSTTEYASDTQTLTPHDHQLPPQHVSPLVAIPVVILTAGVAWYCSITIFRILATHTDSKGGSVPSESLFGFFFLPLLSVLEELPGILRDAMDDNMDHVFERSARESISTLYLTAPLLCVLGWTLGKEMDLKLNGIEVVCLALTVWVFNYLIRRERGDYLVGCLCMGLYLIQVLAFSLAHSRL